jgi:hypothetical protein
MFYLLIFAGGRGQGSSGGAAFLHLFNSDQAQTLAPSKMRQRGVKSGAWPRQVLDSAAPERKPPALAEVSGGSNGERARPEQRTGNPVFLQKGSPIKILT